MSNVYLQLYERDGAGCLTPVLGTSGVVPCRPFERFGTLFKEVGLRRAPRALGYSVGTIRNPESIFNYTHVVGTEFLYQLRAEIKARAERELWWLRVGYDMNESDKWYLDRMEELRLQILDLTPSYRGGRGEFI